MHNLLFIIMEREYYEYENYECSNQTKQDRNY